MSWVMYVLPAIIQSLSVRLNNQQTFKTRAAVIADQAHNPRGALGEGADFMRGLDENERQRKYALMADASAPIDHALVFRAAHDSAKSVRVWMKDLNK